MSALKFNSSLTLSLCLIWETRRPFEHRSRRSPVFAFKNCEWYLELRVDDRTYDLYMVPTKDQEIFPKFTVKTYFLDPQKKKNVLFDSRKEITEADDWLAYVDIADVEKKITNFNTRGIFKIVCAFDDDGSSTQLLGGQQSVHFPLKVESRLSNSECPSSTSGNQNFSLESLSKDLESLLDNKTLPDVQLMVEETSVPCHRAVLVARSRVFAVMFQHEMTESASGVIEIKDMDLATTEIFLKYLYSGKIPDDLTEEMLEKLFNIGDKYEVNALKKVCSNELMKTINDENCLSYLSLAEAHSDQEFKDAVACYIVKDDSLITSEDWIQFSSEEPILANEVYRKYFEKKAMKKN